MIQVEKEMARNCCTPTYQSSRRRSGIRVGPSPSSRNLHVAYRTPWLSSSLFLLVAVSSPWHISAQNLGGPSNLTTAGAAGQVELLVKTFLKKCGRNGQCQDPTISDYYYDPLRASGGPNDILELSTTCGEEVPSAVPLKCGYSRPSFCCTNHLTKYGMGVPAGSTVDATSCFNLTDAAVWHEVSVPVLRIQNYGTDLCYMLVSISETTGARDKANSTITSQGAMAVHEGARGLRGRRPEVVSVLGARQEDEDREEAPPQNVSVTFKSPRVLSQVLDLCLVDEHGNFTDSCGMAVAQPYCTHYKGCLAAASFVKADTEVSGAYYGIITPRGDDAMLPPQSIGYPFAEDLYRRSFQSITCVCPRHPNSQAPVLYSEPVVTISWTAYRVDACKNLVGSSPVNCGAPAANEFCQRKDLVRALSFRSQSTNATTYILGDRVYARGGDAQKGGAHSALSSILCTGMSGEGSGEGKAHR